MRPARTKVETPFQRYVVVDIVSSPEMTEEQILLYSSLMKNKANFVQTKTGDDGKPKEYVIAPRNSIIGKLVDFGSGKAQNSGNLIIMYPFFSSHISLPVKPGEHVWGMSEPDLKTFWLSRVHEPDHVEDPNYTHSDRNELPSVQEIYEVPESSGEVISTVPQFPNGTDFTNREEPKEPSTWKLQSENAYEEIVTGSFHVDKVVYEPVPRLTKRPGDLVLQGSNNSTIVLGTERGFGSGVRPADAEGTNAVPDNDDASLVGLEEGMGSIDIVVGRGRLFGGAESNADADPLETKPRVIKNVRDNFETNKASGLDDTKAPDGSARDNPKEGDPDFVHDASRIYLSMKSSPDTFFGLEYPDQPSNGSTVDPVVDEASIVFKSDQIRIIARKDPENEINGSIRIIKEGTGGEDRATIVIQPDGTIMLDGPKIIIGTGVEKGNGEGDQVFIGRDATEPVVLGNELKTMLSEFLTSIATGLYTGNMGGALVTPIPAAANALKADLDKFLSKNAKTK